LATEEPDDRHLGVLRARHKWPRRCKTKERDEVPSPH
jgi:hypothetical protein